MAGIDLKIESTRVRATLESSRVAAVITSSRVRTKLEFHNYENRNYVLILDDYFAEDYVIDYND